MVRYGILPYLILGNPFFEYQIDKTILNIKLIKLKINDIVMLRVDGEKKLSENERNLRELRE